MQILLVQPDPPAATHTAQFLRDPQFGLHVEVVATQAEALARLRRKAAQTYDVVVSAWTLPDGSGLELLMQLREQNFPLAVVLLAEQFEAKAAITTFKAGGDDYVVKHADYVVQLPHVLQKARWHYQAQLNRQPRPLRVLYAERDENQLHLVSQYLTQQAPYLRLTTVTSAAEALHLLTNAATLSYDAFVLDYQLPDRSALDLLHDLRTRWHLDLPVVVLANQHAEAAVLELLRLGSADYVLRDPGYLDRLPAAIEDAYHIAQLASQRAALRTGEARLRAILEAAQDCIITLNQEGYITEWNPSTERTFGLGRDELLERHLTDLVALPNWNNRPPAEWRDYIAWDTGQVQNRLMRLSGWRANGTAFPLSFTLVRIPLVEATIFTVYARDVSESQRADLARAQLAAIVESSDDAIVSFTLAGTIITWNDSAETLYGYPAVMAIDQPLTLIIPPERHADVPKALERLKRGELLLRQVSIRVRQDGRRVEVWGRFFPVRDAQGVVIGAAYIARPV